MRASDQEHSYRNWTYILRRSKRARNMLMKVSPADGLIVTIPERFKLSHIYKFLDQNEKWIENALQKYSPTTTLVMPTQINLQSIDQIWSINYAVTRDHKANVHDSGNQQIAALNLPTGYWEGTSYFNKWINIKAKGILPNWASHLSTLHELPYSKLTIRRQKTRWGSCSHNDSINLNQNLMFLQPELVTYVILHELVHTEVRNHSRAFWDTLDAHIPQSKNLQSKLFNAMPEVPDWAWQ